MIMNKEVSLARDRTVTFFEESGGNQLQETEQGRHFKSIMARIGPRLQLMVTSNRQCSSKWFHVSFEAVIMLAGA